MKISVDVYFKGFSAPVPMTPEHAFAILFMENLARMVVKMVPNVLLPKEEPKED